MDTFHPFLHYLLTNGVEEVDPRVSRNLPSYNIVDILREDEDRQAKRRGERIRRGHSGVSSSAGEELGMAICLNYASWSPCIAEHVNRFQETTKRLRDGFVLSGEIPSRHAVKGLKTQIRGVLRLSIIALYSLKHMHHTHGPRETWNDVNAKRNDSIARFKEATRRCRYMLNEIKILSICAKIGGIDYSVEYVTDE